METTFNPTTGLLTVREKLPVTDWSRVTVPDNIAEFVGASEHAARAHNEGRNPMSAAWDVNEEIANGNAKAPEGWSDFIKSIEIATTLSWREVRSATLRNLTPHAINVCDADGRLMFTVFPHGDVARLDARRSSSNECGFPMSSVSFGNATGLHDPENDVLFIVSAMVRSALPHRRDLISPGELVRDANGNPIGCKGFDRN